MKKTLISFIILTLFILAYLPFAQAIFGCTPAQGFVIFKSDSGGLHLKVCSFTPATNITGILTNNNIQFANGEIQPISGSFNAKDNMAYAGTVSFNIIIAALTDVVNQYDTPGTTYYHNGIAKHQAEMIGGVLGTFSLFLIEDKNVEIGYNSAGLHINQNGIIDSGEITIQKIKSNGQGNIMQVGALIGNYVRSVGNERFAHPLPQQEFKVSGVKIVFTKDNERKVTFFEDKSNNNFLANYDPTGTTREDLITGEKGSYALFIPEDKKIKSGGGKTYRNGQEIKGDLMLASASRPETLLCCSTIVEYCIPADKRLYPLKSLGTDCSIGLGEMFNAEKASVSGQSTDIINVKVLTKEQIKQLLV